MTKHIVDSELLQDWKLAFHLGRISQSHAIQQMNAILAQPTADCGLEVFTVPGRYLAVNKKNPGAQDVVLKSDADARIAELEESKRSAELALDKAQALNVELRHGIAELEAQLAAPVKQEVVMPPSPYCPELSEEMLTDYEIGELQGRCDMWEEVKRLNGGKQ